VNRPIRVLFVEMSHTLRDILEHAIQAHPEFELWHKPAPAYGRRVNSRNEPDVIILGSLAPDARRVSSLCLRWPQAQVVTVATMNGDISIYELRPHRTDLGELSAAELVEVLREAVRRHRELQRSAQINVC
jgi:chemotaxis response regulator CheB